MKPPPPVPHDWGRATLSAKTVAAAASIALPPASRTPRPTRAAAGDSVATTPIVPDAPARKCEPWRAWAGTAETASRERVRARRVRRIRGESYPGSRGSCALVAAVHGAGQPRADEHARQQPGHGRREVEQRLVADHAREARRLLEVTGRRRRGRAAQRVEEAEAEPGGGGRPEGQVREGVWAMRPPACLHRHKPSGPATRSFSA